MSFLMGEALLRVWLEEDAITEIGKKTQKLAKLNKGGFITVSFDLIWGGEGEVVYLRGPMHVSVRRCHGNRRE